MLFLIKLRSIATCRSAILSKHCFLYNGIFTGFLIKRIHTVTQFSILISNGLLVYGSNLLMLGIIMTSIRRLRSPPFARSFASFQVGLLALMTYFTTSCYRLCERQAFSSEVVLRSARSMSMPIPIQTLLCRDSAGQPSIRFDRFTQFSL